MANILDNTTTEPNHILKYRDAPPKPRFPPFQIPDTSKTVRTKPSNFIREADALKSWCIKYALPYWAHNARDAEGGFYEYLQLNGRPKKDAIRRVRVQARQIFVYAGAARLGWHADGIEIAEKTFDFMKRHGLSPDDAPGFVHLINPDYSINNPTRDLYDHAFYLLGCASLMALKGNSSEVEATALANDLLNYINTTLTSPSGGWVEGDPASLPRRQNPHMHLLETSMALYDATGEKAYLKIAHKVYALFETHFFDAENKIVREFFKDNWTIADGTIGAIAEPGHAAEWVWLLWQYERRTGIDTSPYANALYNNAFKSGAIFLNDEETVTGKPIRETKRLWVQTEVIRAHLAQMERGDNAAEYAAVKAIEAFRNVYLNADGTWVDQIDANENPCADTIPTSTFYHIFGMITEAARIANIT